MNDFTRQVLQGHYQTKTDSPSSRAELLDELSICLDKLLALYPTCPNPDEPRTAKNYIYDAITCINYAIDCVKSNPAPHHETRKCVGGLESESENKEVENESD